jgi:WD40 repeat protein
MAFRGRRYNNNRGNSRGFHQDRGHQSNNPGFQFNNHQGSFQGSNTFRPHVNKPHLCSFFQQSTCTNPNCQNLHQYSYKNEIGRLQLINPNSPVFASCLVTDSQISVACTGKVLIFNIKTASPIAEFPIQGRVKFLLYTTEIPPGFLFFCGDSHNTQLIGAISLSGAVVNFNTQAHAAGVSRMVTKNGLIFVGGDDAKVSVWYYNSQSFELGMTMDVDVSMQGSITCLQIVQNTVLAGLSNGLVVGWEYNFETNQSVWKGNLSPIHKGKVTCLEILNDCFVFSGGEDGIVNCWDASSGFSGGSLLNATKSNPVQISQLMLCENKGTNNLLVGTTQGKILWYVLQQSDAKFVQPLHFHKKNISGLSMFNNLEGYCGFVSTSIDGGIIVSNWNLNP